MELYASLSVCILFVLTTGQLMNTDEEWQNWKIRHDKEYNSAEEEEYRRSIWEERRQYVDRHSNRADVTFTVTLNHMADQVPQAGRAPNEWLQGLRDDFAVNNIGQPPPPKSFDWRSKGVISAVRNQGQMGSSLAVVATECVESYNAIQHQYNLELLSVQECADCCGNQLFTGVGMFACIHNIGGLCEITDYPYKDGHCHNNTVHASVQIAGGRAVPSGREDILQSLLFGRPILAIVDASQTSFQLYQSGVYNEPHCNSVHLNHVVQIVGYGVKGLDEYWIVKNSWGSNWGIDGYILMSKDKGNQCGIASAAAYPY